MGQLYPTLEVDVIARYLELLMLGDKASASQHDNKSNHALEVVS